MPADAPQQQQQQPAPTPELDDFGLPSRPKLQRHNSASSDEFQSADEGDGEEGGHEGSEKEDNEHCQPDHEHNAAPTDSKEASSEVVKDPAPASGGKPAAEDAGAPPAESGAKTPGEAKTDVNGGSEGAPMQKKVEASNASAGNAGTSPSPAAAVTEQDPKQLPSDAKDSHEKDGSKKEGPPRPIHPIDTRKARANSKSSLGSPTSTRKSRAGSSAAEPHKEIGGVSEWSHQALAPPEEEVEVEEEVTWQAMPTDSKMDYYDDFGHLVAKGDRDLDDDDFDPIKGGAGKGYTRVQLDDDAQSATSMDDHTAYLFKGAGQGGTNVVDDEDEEEGRNPLAQMQATKDLLTEGQRIAYVGVTRLSMEEMKKEVDRMQVTKKFKKDYQNATENLKMWSQKMMVRLYAHMDISSSEQVMIEQLAEHGIKPSDMTQALMQNSRVRNPLAEAPEDKAPGKEASPRTSKEEERAKDAEEEEATEPPPPYTEEEKSHVPEAVDPSTLEKKQNLDIDLRWTVLCDLFLVLISDSIYDSRSRVLLETVGEALEISWLDICRFEKRVTDALEMQEEASTEDWDESDTIEARRKMALKRKYLMMGLATAGGGLLIGLTAGVLAPVIGAGLAAGFSAIGVAGTSGFLAGAGGAAIITTSSAIAGGSIAVNASRRRMGAVQTFEYRPLHNNKRVNLILTISGWMNGKVDDVRLPFSTVDPIMGDIYSLYWEPEVLQSVGDTMRIIATEALTQGLQQVLASTFLTALMAGLSAPIILSKLSYLIDNPWSSSCDRAERAGLILADSIIDRHLGVRPISFVGFSLGSRVIFSCLKELSRRGAYGLVQNVYIFGSPVIFDKEEWLRARTVVSGRFVNGYASNDWILGYLFRATGAGISKVAGLAPVENVPGIENFSCTDIVNGHMAYRSAMPRLLREVGWEVLSDEFTEIEDPDPENHESRQRELIQEIEDARQAAQKQPEKRRWWSNKKKQEKKAWETYDQPGKQQQATSPRPGAGDDKDDRSNVLFDIDAIRRELESEHMEVRQLESTLPPMQLSLERPAQDTAAEEKPAAPTRSASVGLNPFAAFGRARKNSGTGSNAADSPSSAKKSTDTNGSTGGGKSPKPDSGSDVSKTKKSPASANMYDYDEDEDADPALNGVTMSFERPPAGGGEDEHHEATASGGGWGDLPATAHATAADQQPPLRSSSTAPAAVAEGPVNLEHNAWADDGGHGRHGAHGYDGGDDEQHEEEGEITMTFG